MANKTYQLDKSGDKVKQLLNKINNLSKSDIGLDQVDNTSDIDKPVSILQRQALNEVLEEAKQYTDKEIAEFDFIKIANLLPQTGLPNKIYLVPKTDTDEQNLFDEYLWINNSWEYISTKTIEVDLSDLYTKDETDHLLSGKVDKVDGKDLSTNDFTNEEKAKLAGLSNYDDTELKLRDERLKYYGDPNIVPTDTSFFTFTTNDETVTASISLTDEAKANTEVTNVIIPYKYVVNEKEYIVTSIGDRAFYNCSNLTNITIPNSVTSIGDYAFQYCRGIIRITIPNSVTNISNIAFIDTNTELTIICAEGSYADTFVKENNIPVEYTNEVTKKYVDEQIDDLSGNFIEVSELVEVNRKLNLKFDTPTINLLDYESRLIDKSIYSGDGEERDNTSWDASPFILLEPNTSYYAYGMYIESFYCFYDLNKKKVSEGYTFTKTTSNYNGIITIGDNPLYFRCSIGKNNAEAYISKYTDSYVPYGQVDFSFLSKKNTDDIEELKSLNRGYYNKKVLVMGDSISVDYYGNYPKWVTVLINEGYFPKDTTNSSIHATGFVAKYTEDPNADNDFLTRIEAIQNKDEFDLVVIFGGINDFIQSIPMGESGGDETVYFKPAVDYFFDYLINNFTQARIVVLSPLRTHNPYPNKVSVKQEEYADYIREVAKSYCLPILNLTEESGFCPFIDSFSNRWTYTGWGGEENIVGDGVHPNAEYEEKFLAPMIRNFLNSLI